jgi:alkylation response protein AidB-like acyl-CoA dehydrogenase
MKRSNAFAIPRSALLISEMVLHDGEARRRGYVGHELWRRAGEFGFLCVDIPEELDDCSIRSAAKPSIPRSCSSGRCGFPADNLLGGVEGQSFYQLMADLPYERMMIGVSALAAMEGAYRATLDYVRERQAFGRPIGDFQNTRFKLAEVATQITVSRAFIDRCVE